MFEINVTLSPSPELLAFGQSILRAAELLTIGPKPIVQGINEGLQEPDANAAKIAGVAKDATEQVSMQARAANAAQAIVDLANQQAKAAPNEEPAKEEKPETGLKTPTELRAYLTDTIRSMGLGAQLRPICFDILEACGCKKLTEVTTAEEQKEFFAAIERLKAGLPVVEPK